MKKLLFSTLLTLSVLFSSQTLTGCDYSDLGTFEEMQADLAQKFMAAFNSGNEPEVRNLFASAKIPEDPSFDSDLKTLLPYINGEIVDFKPNGAHEIYDSDENFKCRIRSFSTKFYTADKEYRIAFHYCCEYVQDSKVNEDMLGIWSLYVIDLDDFVRDESYTYWGDGKETTGINIGVNPTE